jgi:DNA-binding transcriptional MerR regulator
MTTKSTRTYLSIGEVLSLLRVDFPDVTISKIRFLEGQGLICPERTSSGYRKFHEPDVERLRFVLRHQREHFLPLKVIKERMVDAGLAPAEPTPTRARRNSVSELVAALQETPPSSHSAPDGAPSPVRRDAARSTPMRPAAPHTAGAGGRTPKPATPPVSAAEPADQPVPAKPGPPRLTAEDVAAQAGIDVAAVASLVEYGLITPAASRTGGGFDDDSVAIAKAAAGFFEIGLEPRHLKVLRHGVDRELGMIDTLVLPLLQSRTTEGRVRAREQATHFARLSTALRAAILRAALRDTLG